MPHLRFSHESFLPVKRETTALAATGENVTTEQAQKQPQKASSKLRSAVPIALILIGLLITVIFGIRSVHSFRQVRYIQQQGLDAGTASVDAIQPWMTIRFIAVAYAVPEEYLYSALEIPFDRRNANRPLGLIPPVPPSPPSHQGNEPTPAPADSDSGIVEEAKAAVLAYRADPVATGLREVRPWMSLRYISNSLGISLDEIYSKTGLSPEIEADKPLELVAEEEQYPGGARALSDDVAKALGLETGRERRP